MELKVNDPKLIEAIFNGDAPDIYFAPDVDTLIAEKDALIAELKQKLESVQASMYADVVDANMDNRRLRRALWLARAEWARSSALSYHLIENHPDKDADKDAEGYRCLIAETPFGVSEDGWLPPR